MGTYKYTTALYLYLRKYTTKQDKSPRTLKATEYAILQKYQKLAKDINALTTELFTLISILRCLGIPETRYLISNFYMMTQSLTKQRDKSIFIRQAYVVISPTEEEFAEIKRFLSSVGTRLAYIRTEVIPGNLEFTPIKEYLEICQRQDIQEDLYAYFGNLQNMAVANQDKDSKIIKQYVERILTAVRDAGELENYQTRIKNYASKRAAIEQEVKQEETAQMLAEKRTRAEEGMMKFHWAFNSAVCNLESDESIGVGVKALSHKIHKNGRDNYYVLCCFISRGHYCYRYLGEDDKIISTFAAARAFKCEQDATDAIARISPQYPDRVFGIVDF